MMKIRFLFLVSFIYTLLLFFGVPAYAQAVSGDKKFSPYLPGELNEYALEYLQSGDSYTAKIFLERANRLNPLSPDIQSNLEIVQKIRASKNAFEVQGISARGEIGVSKESSESAINSIPGIWPKP